MTNTRILKKNNIFLLYHNSSNNKNKRQQCSIKFAMYRYVCMYVKTRISLVRNNSEKERGQLVLTCLRVYVSSGMYKPLNLFVIQAHY